MSIFRIRARRRLADGPAVGDGQSDHRRRRSAHQLDVLGPLGVRSRSTPRPTARRWSAAATASPAGGAGHRGARARAARSSCWLAPPADSSSPRASCHRTSSTRRDGGRLARPSRLRHRAVAALPRLVATRLRLRPDADARRRSRVTPGQRHGVAACARQAGPAGDGQHMGCAMGVCLGCVVMTRSGYQRVCRDGPVFPPTSWSGRALHAENRRPSTTARRPLEPPVNLAPNNMHGLQLPTRSWSPRAPSATAPSTSRWSTSSGSARSARRASRSPRAGNPTHGSPRLRPGC